MSPPTEQDLDTLRATLRRCSPATIEAAVHFRTTGDVSSLPAIVYGIIERHLPAENKRDLSEAPDSTRLVEDLGIDSLTLLEIVLSIEEAVSISIENEELREIRTLGEVKTFIQRKITQAPGPGAAVVRKARTYNRLDIIARLPQQPPFLFVDEAEIQDNVVRARYTIRGDEAFLEGHFKGNPVMPASLVFEAVGQAACLWVLERVPEELGAALNHNEVLFASMEDAHFYRRAKPGDTIEMEAEMERLREPLAVFRGRATLRGERLAEIGHLVLAFGPEVVEHLENRETGEKSPADAAGGGNSAAPNLTTDAMPAADSPFADVASPARPMGDPGT